MKNCHLLMPGELLKLKPDRQAAYGLESPVVTFKRIHPRQGYKIPWIIALDSTQSHGHYKPADFAGKVLD